MLHERTADSLKQLVSLWLDTLAWTGVAATRRDLALAPRSWRRRVRTNTHPCVRSLDEASLAVLLVRPELAKMRAINAPYYDTTLEELVYPESDARQVSLYDEIETQAVSEEFINALFNPFVSCEWE